MRSRRTAVLATSVLATSVTVSLLTVGAPAAAKGGEVGWGGAEYHLSNGWGGRTDRTFSYGREGDRVYVGDWDGDGTDTLAVRRGATYHFSDRLSGGEADRVVTYGRPWDTVLVGDWDGDGIDTPAVRRDATYYLTNSLSGGNAEQVVSYGRPGDVVVVGDWDGDGRDTLGVRRGATYYLKNSIADGAADIVVTFGRARDEVVVGDWDGDGRDTLGVRRGNVVHVKDTIAGGRADHVMRFGRAGDAVMVGDWDGNRTDTIGLRRERPGQQQPPPRGGLIEFDARTVQLINAERADAGVPAVRAWTALRDGSLRHSRWMARTGTFEHASWRTISADGAAAGCEASAENIFWGSSSYADPAAVLREYMSSPGHRANILDPANRFVAVGSVQSDNHRIYNTQRFARSCS